MDMDAFFSETNIASLRHLALPGITATDRTALFEVLSMRFVDAQNLSKHPRLASRDDSHRAISAARFWHDEGNREMENLGQLHHKLNRRQFRQTGG